ncbi:MAG: hypothetical protein WCL51_09940 [Bacteroidota bacterium]
MQFKTRLLLISLIFIFSIISSFAQEVNIDGIYAGKNLIVLNPSSGDGYCVNEVWVNGQKTHDEIISNSFEIDFPNMHIETGKNVHVRIFHKNGCKPKIINPEVLEETIAFSFGIPKINKKKFLTWELKGNSGEGKFVVEQYRWRKWIKAAEVKNTDTTSRNNYTVEISPNTGQNLFRIIFKDSQGKETYSKETKYVVPGREITIVTEKIKDRIEFSSPTMYEVLDANGKVLITGEEKYIDTSALPKGKYTVNYDNKYEVVSKR